MCNLGEKNVLNTKRLKMRFENRDSVTRVTNTRLLSLLGVNKNYLKIGMWF